MINRNIIEVTRSQATEFVFKTFHCNESIIEHHLDVIERKPNDYAKEVLRKYFNNSCQISNLIILRMLILIGEDNLTIQCVLNQNNSLTYRAIAVRCLNNPTNFQDDFRRILNNEREPTELRIISFQVISSFLNLSEIHNLSKRVQSKQFQFYIQSLFKNSSIWLANSGSYRFPFGKINIIFDENLPSYLPNMIQSELINSTQFDFYFVRDTEKYVVRTFLYIFINSILAFFFFC